MIKYLLLFIDDLELYNHYVDQISNKTVFDLKTKIELDFESKYSNQLYFRLKKKEEIVNNIIGCNSEFIDSNR